MSDDQDGGSSSGLMIGMIIGGVVVLVLVVLGLLGLGFFYARPVPGGPVPVGVVMEEAAPPVEVAGPAAAGGEGPPMPLAEKELTPQAKRLLGEWETTQPDGTRATMIFGLDGRLRFMKQPPAADAPDSMMLRWEILEGNGDRCEIRYTSDNKVYDVQQEFEFQADDRLVIHGPFRVNDRWVVKDRDGTATYHRKK